MDLGRTVHRRLAVGQAMGVLAVLMLLDALVLLVSGGVLMVRPVAVGRSLGLVRFNRVWLVPLGLWGCTLVALGVGYLLGAANPWRSRVLVQLGLVRGALEFGLGLYYLAKGIAVGLPLELTVALAGFFAAGYAVCYPRATTDLDEGTAEQTRTIVEHG